MDHFFFGRKGNVSSTTGPDAGVGGRFLKEGAAADLDDLGVEVDDGFVDLDHRELEEVFVLN